MSFKKTNLFYIFFILLLSKNIFAGVTDQKTSSEIFIDILRVKQNSAQTFTTSFSLNINSNIFLNWQLGFFSFQFYHDPNSQIKMQICEEENSFNCSDLKITINKNPETYEDYKKSDLTAGYLTVLSPVSAFHLLPNKSYRVFLSGAKWIPQNISMMPQGFFIYNVDEYKVTNISVQQYLNESFDSDKAEMALKNRIKLNWIRSTPFYGNDAPIVPLPVFLKTYPERGIFSFKEMKKIHYIRQDDFKNADQLRNALKWDLSLSEISIDQIKSNSGINLLSCSATKKCSKIKNKSKEGYVIDLFKNENNASVINIYTYSPAGSFYAIQTLRQLWNADDKVTTQTIIDYPRFSYRGFSLDTARHFFTVTEVKLLLDVMAAHKLNTLHLHLADDEGWRIKVSGFPELTAKGSKRFWGYEIGPAYLIDGHFDISNAENIPYALADTNYRGYYTKQDIFDLVFYANERQITIIPEIEMPGHARAMIKASPDKFADPNDRSVYFGVQGYQDNVLPICQYGSNRKFKRNINLLIQNISHLFKDQTTQYALSQEISLSGDEVSPNALTNYFPCNQYPWNSYQTTSGKSHLFFQKISQNLPEEIKISGWQQIVQNDDGSISDNTVSPQKLGHAWAWIPTTTQGLNLASQLLQKNYPTVIAFADYSYFDIAYTTQWKEPGLLWATSFSDTYKVLSLGSKIEEIPNKEKILGLEGALWSEIVPSKEHLMYMILPKMAGLAEAAWSPLPENDLKINWQSLASRLGNGNEGYLSYLNRIYKVRYRGYPNGIQLEIP